MARLQQELLRGCLSGSGPSRGCILLPVCCVETVRSSIRNELQPARLDAFTRGISIPLDTHQLAHYRARWLMSCCRDREREHRRQRPECRHARPCENPAVPPAPIRRKSAPLRASVWAGNLNAARA